MHNEGKEQIEEDKKRKMGRRVLSERSRGRGKVTEWRRQLAWDADKLSRNKQGYGQENHPLSFWHFNYNIFPMLQLCCCFTGFGNF